MITLLLFTLNQLLATNHLAEAKVEARSGSTVAGTATFFEDKLKLKLENLTPGKHGFHIHEKGDCSAPDAASAGGHFNPTGTKHAGPKDKEHHAGDFGNVTADKNGKVNTTIPLKFSADFIGKSIVVHESEDDLKSQPAGNSGKRIGCGSIH